VYADVVYKGGVTKLLLMTVNVAERKFSRILYSHGAKVFDTI
jgi:hypothetical protein